jgi:HAMP domain-containing protein
MTPYTMGSAVFPNSLSEPFSGGRAASCPTGLRLDAHDPMVPDVVRRGPARRCRVGRPTIRRTVAWFAVLAVLAQTVLFDFAMAARETAAARERATAAHHAAQQAPRNDPDAPQNQHGGKDCAFCLARATHQAPTPPAGAALPLPLPIAVVVPPLPRVRVRARRRPTRFRSRSPPREP